MYVGGLAPGVSGGPSRSVVLKSDDGAATFSEVDSYNFESASPCWGWHVAVGSDGTVYGSGWCFAATGSRWIVRVSSDQGTSWSTALDLAGGGSAVVPIEVSGANEVFVAGLNAGWHVHKRSAQGTWGASDGFTLAPGKGGLPTRVRALSRVYVLGVAPDAADVRHWIVRRSDASASAWSTIHDLAAPAGTTLGGFGGVHEDGSGAILLAATFPDASDVTRALTRKSTDDGATWQMLDDYQYASGQATTAGGWAADAAGNLYAAVAGTDAGGSSRWLVRKLACQ